MTYITKKLNTTTVNCKVYDELSDSVIVKSITVVGNQKGTKGFESLVRRTARKEGITLLSIDSDSVTLSSNTYRIPYDKFIECAELVKSE